MDPLQVLDASHLLRVNRGSMWLRSIITEFMASVLPSIINTRNCITCVTEIASVTNAWWAQQFSQFMRDPDDPLVDPVVVLGKVEQWVERRENGWPRGVCDGCVQKTAFAVNVCREYIWDEMP